MPLQLALYSIYTVAAALHSRVKVSLKKSQDHEVHVHLQEYKWLQVQIKLMMVVSFP